MRAWCERSKTSSTRRAVARGQRPLAPGGQLRGGKDLSPPGGAVARGQGPLAPQSAVARGRTSRRLAPSRDGRPASDGRPIRPSPYPGLVDGCLACSDDSGPGDRTGDPQHGGDGRLERLPATGANRSAYLAALCCDDLEQRAESGLRNDVANVLRALARGSLLRLQSGKRGLGRSCHSCTLALGKVA